MSHAARAVLAGCALLALTSAAIAVVPGEAHHQGLLLDGAGDPRDGSVGLVFSLFDVAVAGSALWTESHPGVVVQAGTYQVTLGSSTPIPATLLGGGARFLEISVDGEILTPRQPFSAVPYAVRAASAASAESMNGVSSVFVSQIYTHFAFDGSPPPNDDPSEGLADVDADGLANFVDPDNDGDGITDASELAGGSDINLITPQISNFMPSTAEASFGQTVTVNGAGFEPGLSVIFGSESPTPQNLTAGGFDLDVGPQAAGTVAVQITNANGETDSGSFDFVNTQPTISNVAPDSVSSTLAATVSVTGSGFVPGLLVSIGTQSPVPANLTPSSFEVDVGPQAPGGVTLQVSYPSGLFDSAPFDFVDTSNAKQVFVSSAVYDGGLGGLAGADAKCNALAAAAGLSGSYRAWISDQTGSPTTSFTQSTEPWILTDGGLVARDWADLIDGSIEVAISVDENGTSHSSLVWTNTTTGGENAPSNLSCGNWTNAPGFDFGRSGGSGNTFGSWTLIASQLYSCDDTHRLYCFEQ